MGKHIVSMAGESVLPFACGLRGIWYSGLLAGKIIKNKLVVKDGKRRHQQQADNKNGNTVRKIIGI